MNWSDLIELTKNGNTTTVHVVPTLNSIADIAPDIISLANTKGGKLVIGLDIKNYHLLGSDINSKWLEDHLKATCSPGFPVKLDTLTRHDKSIIILTVPEGQNKPYAFNRQFYIRDENKARIASIEEEQALRKQGLSVTKKPHPPTEIIPINSVKIDSARANLNRPQLEALTYLDIHKSIKNKEYREQFEVSHKTAHYELVELVQKGLIMSQGSGRSTCYVPASEGLYS